MKASIRTQVRLLSLRVTDKEKIAKALEVAFRYGGFDGGHHKAWAIDQMVRALTGSEYEQWRADYEGDPEDEDNHYFWDEGIVP